MAARAKSKTPRVDVYEQVTAQIVEALEAGTVPWRRPWKERTATAFATDGRPRHAVSGKPYRGANAFTLPLAMMANGWTDPRFVSFKQAQQLGGQVRKGEKSNVVTFWKFFEREQTPGGKVDRIPMLRTFPVFNVEQCDGIPAAPVPDVAAAPTDERCEAVIAAMKLRPAIRRNGSAAFYEPTADRVTMPASQAFHSVDGFYHVFFHELAHSTGHASRLKREEGMGGHFGSVDYSREELIAEFTAAMVGLAVGIDPDVPTSAAYISSWASRLKSDPKAVIQAASKAQRAADWILGVEWAKDEPVPAKVEKVAAVAVEPVTEPVQFALAV